MKQLMPITLAVVFGTTFLANTAYSEDAGEIARKDNPAPAVGVPASPSEPADMKEKMPSDLLKKTESMMGPDAAPAKPAVQPSQFVPAESVSPEKKGAPGK